MCRLPQYMPVAGRTGSPASPLFGAWEGVIPYGPGSIPYGGRQRRRVYGLTEHGDNEFWQTFTANLTYRPTAEERPCGRDRSSGGAWR